MLNCREEYFGLRVRKTEDPTQAINIPVNITVGTSGALSLAQQCFHAQEAWLQQIEIHRSGLFCMSRGLLGPHTLQDIAVDQTHVQVVTNC